MRTNQQGFTLIEVLIVMALIAILSGVTMVTISSPHSSAVTSGTIDTLLTDIKAQQLKATVGESGSASSAADQGVYMQDNSSQYTLFKGSTYSAVDSDNFTVQLETGLTIDTDMTSDELVFTRLSGDVSGWMSNKSTITLTNTISNTASTITVNRYGGLTVQ